MQYTPNGDVERSEQFAGAANSEVTRLDYASQGPDPTNNLTAGQFGGLESYTVDYNPAATTAPFKYLPASRTDTEGSRQIYRYDDVGNLTEVRDAQARNVAALTYNTDGTLASATDGNLHRTTYEYFANGNRKRVVPPPASAPSNPLGPTSYTYDALSRVKTVTDGRGVTTTMQYDNLDRVVSVRASDGNEIFYTYDDNGNIERRESSTGDLTQYDYDHLNRITDESFPGGRFNEYTYDKASNLASITDASGTVRYGYDDIDRINSIQAPKPGGGTDTITYSYQDPAPDQSGPRSQTQTLPGGVTQRTTYDRAGKIVRILATNSAGAKLKERVYAYLDDATPRALVRGVVDENRNVTEYSYRDSVEDVPRLGVARTRDASGTTIEHLTYGYDKAGNRTRRARVTPTGGETTTYEYNETNQLCWRHSAASTNSCATPPAGATTFTYDSAGNQLTGDTTLAWDSFGRLSAAAGQTIRNLSPSNGELTGQGTTRFQNNAFGLGRIDSTASSDTTSIQRDPTTGLPVSQITNGEKRFYLQDHLGSTTALTTPSGTVARSYTYDPDGNGSSTGTGPEASLRFAAGHELDGTGLYHFGARYYDPRTARWTQTDPVEQPTSISEGNAYTYAGGDPINRSDPTGCGSVAQFFACALGCVYKHCDEPEAIIADCWTSPVTGWREAIEVSACLAGKCGTGSKQFYECVKGCWKSYYTPKWWQKLPRIRLPKLPPIPIQ